MFNVMSMLMMMMMTTVVSLISLMIFMIIIIIIIVIIMMSASCIILLTYLSDHVILFSGSLAFVRAVNEPPMKPLFPCWPHFATDELLGSWMFFIATLPAVPYSLVYLSVSREYLYFGMFAASLIALLGTYFFVLSCYPSEKVSADYGIVIV